MYYSKHINVFTRMDSLIQRKATGTPVQFAKKLGVSRATVFRYLDVLKNDFQAPIEYSKEKETYKYSGDFSLKKKII